MRNTGHRQRSEITLAQSTTNGTENNTIDLRFRSLLSSDSWRSLPSRVQQRFSKRLAGNRLAVYEGHITDLRMNITGRILAQVLRLVGAPLPISTDEDVPSLVCVSEDVATGGQIWTRMYGRKSAFPQIIHSAKRFSGPTGLEEYIGFGISIALHVSVEGEALVFSSNAYQFHLFSRRIPLPRWLSPGRLRVEHCDLERGKFRFSLSLEHPLFGELVYQSGLYRDRLEPPK